MVSAASEGFRVISRRRASEEVVRQIRDLIGGGQIHPGDRFPAERELCRVLDVGRSTLREAMRALEALGLVRVVPGQGTFLVELPGAAEESGPATDSRLKAWERQREMFQVREILEPGLAALAARHATAAQRERIRSRFRAQEAGMRQGRSGMLDNTAFHMAVAEAANNSILLQMVLSFLDLLRETRLTAWQSPERPGRSVREHARILAAIEARNPRAAERAMRQHVREARRFVLLAKGAPPAG
jgi:GntR family transcriptional repressor for pyruvate dehydrogenase complex